MSIGIRRFLLAAGLTLAVGAFAPSVSALTADVLKDRVERLPAAAPRAGRGEAAPAIRGFYAQRDYRPLWFADSRPTPRAQAVLAALAKAAEHGLDPARYGMPRLEARIRAATGDVEAEAELALTRAYLDYAADLSSGIVGNPRQVGRIFRDAKRTPPGQHLAGIADAADPAAFLAHLPPDTRRYDALKAAWAERDGTIHFRPDVYRRHAALEDAMRRIARAK